ncbi:MAG: hypothetical protein ACI9LM_000503 [Alteromonadaceae bacterium]|jgi:hypothetical protein
MLFRMSWLLSLVIYLSVNGQVFTAPIHLCQAMANTSISLLVSSDTPSSHQDQHQVHQMDEEAFLVRNIKNKAENFSEQTSMDNCQCVDCDCTANIVSQANSAMLSKEALTVFLLHVEGALSKRATTFISQPHSNLYRPPIFL